MKKTILLFFLTLTLVLSFVSTGATSGRTYKLRDRGPAGGWVFYDKGSYSNGWRYLEAAPTDESRAYQWKTSAAATSGTSTDIGTGYNNTYNCMTGAEHPAAEVARNARHGGKTGWFLPSKDELNLMYKNLKQHNVGGFAAGYYWSSSEYSSDDAWCLYFDNGYENFIDKTYFKRVRAVRAF